MVQDKGLVVRGMLLLGMMLVLVSLVALVVFRRPETPAANNSQQSGLVMAALPAPGLAFPGTVNWGGLAALTDKMPDGAGWNVRYNAVIALARAGSERLPLNVLCQMLDEDLQMRNFPGDEQSARHTVSNALKALVDWHSQKEAVDKVGRDSPALRAAYTKVEHLTHSTNDALKQEAATIQEKIASGKW
jgi:hypothetical protein